MFWRYKFGFQFGGFGDDVLTGTSHRDFIFGFFGDDIIEGGAGADRIYGGWGFDTAVYEGSAEDYTISGLRNHGWGPIRAKVTDANGDTDRLHSVEALYFRGDDYTAYLDGRNNAVLARDDAAALDATGGVIAGLTDNDYDFDGDTLTIISIDTTGLVGSAVLNDDGTISYSSDGAFDPLAEGQTAQTTFTYTVSDGNGSTDTATVTLTITGVNDAPVLTLASTAIVAENETAVTTASATDVDGDAVTYALSGDDAALFAIDADGVLTFINAPDFEAPADADGDNTYDVTVTASDGSLSDSADIAVTVTDVDETPPPFINEFHYDNAGADTGEFIELAGPAGRNIDGWTIVLYNGNGGAAYNTISLSGSLSGTEGEGYTSVDVPGLQNGGPDGIALVSPTGEVTEFISYEGAFEALDGPAAGMMSTDIGVSEPSTTAIGDSLQREADGSWSGPRENTRDASNDEVSEPIVVKLNEFHYDNAGADTGEFIEVAGTAGADLTGWSIVLYNGNGGAPYSTISLAGSLSGTEGEGYASVDTPGLQNGGPDGIALVDPDGNVVEFFSYEGTFEAVGGPADGMMSTDIGVSEPSSTDIGQSLQREADDTWSGPRDNTRDASNDGGSGPAMVMINEFHYDNAGADTGEFIELAGTAGADVTGWSIVLYNGNGGGAYSTISLAGSLSGTEGEGYISVDTPGIQNGGPDGIALVDADGNVVEFISYEGTFEAADGPAAGMMSTDIGVSETSSTDIGDSLQKIDGVWQAPAANTRDAANDGGVINPPPSETTLISSIQGAGSATPLDGQTVSVSAVVTAVVSNGFYLQEEDADADGNDATSEGIFVFTGDTPNVSVTDVVYATGTVSEFFDATQISADTYSMIGTAALPTAANLSLPDSISLLENFEGMQVSLAAGAGNAPLTIIENFNFDRYGEITISEGTQIQPTQIYDAQTQLAEIQALQAQNAANRIKLDDGVGSQNPSSFHYIANTSAGDDGDGILGSGDTFTEDGPTVRLGAEITAPINGVLSYSFGEYKIIPTETLQIDPATNEGARDATVPDVGGDLKVVSFNALNYFTTLGERGAFTAEDLARQTEKLVNALEALDADIVGLQEVENNGFGADSAIATLTDALNARVGAGTYAYVDPTDDAGPIGTDVITTGFIYKTDSVTEIASDFLVFDDGGQQRNRPATAATFEDADGERITVAVNHFKSKGGTGTGDDADQGNGQGNFNAVRTGAAEQLTDWLATDPLGSGDPDVLIIGDLNAYLQEDPVQAIEAAGYDNLLEDFVGADDAFSFIFGGQQGALDHALATESLRGQITGVSEWHINAQEPDLLSYNSRFTDAGFYNGDDVFSSSDHDPLIIGLDLGAETLLA